MNKTEWILTTEEYAAHGLLAIMGMKGLVTKETVYKIQEVTAIAAQKKLLNWLLENHYLGHSLIDPMLKQLKEVK
jgi:hypothetical protein